MCDLDSFSLLTIEGQMKVCDRMLADRTPSESARAARRAKTLSPLTAAPVLPLAGNPPGRVAVSTLSEEFA